MMNNIKKNSKKTKLLIGVPTLMLSSFLIYKSIKPDFDKYKLVSSRSITTYRSSELKKGDDLFYKSFFYAYRLRDIYKVLNGKLSKLYLKRARKEIYTINNNLELMQRIFFEKSDKEKKEIASNLITCENLFINICYKLAEKGISKQEMSKFAEKSFIRKDYYNIYK